MKNQLLFVIMACCLLINNSIIAQAPILTNVNPAIGGSYTYNGIGSYTDPGSSGTGQLWDFSSLNGTSGGLTNFVSPSSTADGSSFPNANVCGSNTSTSIFSYFKTSTSKLENLGSVSSTVMSYSNSEEMLRYPFNYGNSYSDTWQATFISSGYNFVRKGTTTVTADGYGTVILPSGTYTDVMRIHYVQVYTDSSYISGAPYIINYTNDEYMWYKEGIYPPLVIDYTLTSSAALNPYTGTSYLASTPATDINEIDNANLIFNVFPNPANETVTIKIDDKLVGSVYSFIDQLGRTILTGKLISVSSNINISELSSGFYLLKVGENKPISVIKN